MLPPQGSVTPDTFKWQTISDDVYACYTDILTMCWDAVATKWKAKYLQGTGIVQFWVQSEYSKNTPTFSLFLHPF